VPPAKTTSSEKLSPGDHLEVRVARLWFWEGHYARRAVDLRRHYHPEPLLVTDLDLLAFELSPMLQVTKSIGESKSGTGKSAPKALDRIVWIRGLMALVDADKAEYVAAAAPSPRAKELARSLGVRAQSEGDIARREHLVRIQDVTDLGAHGPRAFAEQGWVRDQCGKDEQLSKAFWFLRSEVWFLDSATAAKRLIGLFGQLAGLWAPAIEDDNSRVLRWLLAETVSVFTLNTVALASEALLDDPALLGQRLGDRLSAGYASADAMRRISRDVDKFVAGLLVISNAPADVKAGAVGAMHPTPPTWTQPFLELLERIAAARETAVQLPRQMDVLVHERIVWRRNLKAEPIRRLQMDRPEVGRLVRLIAAFLRHQAAHIEVVDRALTAEIPRGSNGTSSTGPLDCVPADGGNQGSLQLADP
jgi:hypothetical protein